ncbi:MAG: hypothetical protein KJZ87_09065 [Thermoguttaceae bacterium]|nr:hypothetical protein [Thermoguttaceae bacterium]
MPDLRRFNLQVERHLVKVAARLLPGHQFHKAGTGFLLPGERFGRRHGSKGQEISKNPDWRLEP